ncbi:MAG: hypothetical protein ACOYBE_00325 [Blautia sp.]|jgi:hypothetical protein
MKEKIIQVLFDSWCEGEFGIDYAADQISDGAINDIVEHFKAKGNDQNYIETNVMRAVCIHEKAAFLAGVRIGLALITGSIWAAH